MELRYEGTGWLVLRRLDGSGWIRGWSNYAGGGEVATSRERRRLALSHHGGSFHRLWLHAATLRELLETGDPIEVAGQELPHAWLSGLVEGASPADPSLLGDIAVPGGELAIVVQSEWTRGPRCEVTIAAAGGSARALVVIRGVVPGGGGSFGFVTTPPTLAFFERGRVRVELDRVEPDFYTGHPQRSWDFATTPSVIAIDQLAGLGRAASLRVCDAACCYEASDAFRQELATVAERHARLSSLIAERPTSSEIGPEPTGPPRAP